MSRICKSCNAKIDSGMEICPNCGKIVRHTERRRPDNNEVKRKRNPNIHNQQINKNVKRKRVSENIIEEKSNESRLKRSDFSRYRDYHNDNYVKTKKNNVNTVKIIKRTIAVIIVLLIVYFAIFFVQISRVKHTEYKFDISMKMKYDNFGDAFKNSLNDGHWSYNPFLFRLTYSGTHNKKDYAIKFRTLGTVDVIEIDEGDKVKIKEEDIKNYLMGFFI